MASCVDTVAIPTQVAPLRFLHATDRVRSRLRSTSANLPYRCLAGNANEESCVAQQSAFRMLAEYREQLDNTTTDRSNDP